MKFDLTSFDESLLKNNSKVMPFSSLYTLLHLLCLVYITITSFIVLNHQRGVQNNVGAQSSALKREGARTEI